MNSTALDHPTHEQDLTAPLAIGEIDRKKWEIIKKTVAKDASDEEVAVFLELSHKYGLDPFAKEIWCVKGGGRDGGTGRMMIMVGRDGLRKIAQRNGIHIDGDVVYSNDSLTIVRAPNGNRTVAHEWTPTERGEIIGAWAECRFGGPEGQPLGFFYAPLSEYMPTSEGKLKYSPWATQKSVMILAAAERQALRQATPLSGLVVEGEGEINQEVAEGRHGGRATREDLLDAIIDNIPEAHQERARDLIDEMNSLAPGHWTPGKVELIFKGKSAYATTVELASIEKQIEELQSRPAAEPVDAEVVDPEQESDGEPDAEAVAAVEALRPREEELERDLATAEPGSRAADELGQELEQVQDEIRRHGFTPAAEAAVEPGPGQDSLL